MPIDVEWDDEAKTIVRQTYGEIVSNEDYYYAIQKNVELMSSVNHPVDLIIDVRNIKKNVRGIITMAQYANKMVPQNQRLVVLVGVNPIIKSFINVLSRIAPRAAQNSRIADTIEQAHQMIADFRAKL